jgi:hypothetical protein
MAAAAEGRQHGAGIIVVARLSERPAVEIDDGIGADRQIGRRAGAFGFAACVNEGRLDW